MMASTHANPIQEGLAMDYLMKFGYLQPTQADRKNAEEPDPSKVKAALESLQRIGHITITGELDDATRDLMKQRRCGNSTLALPRADWTAKGRLWDRAIISWKLGNWTNDLTGE
ncbi:MAG: hypothetical protein Q9218_005242, partial [Villophora microphyllina]